MEFMELGSTDMEGSDATLYNAVTPTAEGTVQQVEDGWILPSGSKPMLGPIKHWILVLFSILLTIATASAYLVWKLLLFIRLWRSTTLVSVVFYILEMAFYLSGLMCLVEFSRPVVPRKRLAVDKCGPFPRVAVLVTSCKEELEVLKDTVLAALAQDYPSDRYSVWVLDDGGDDELQLWVETLAKESGRQLFYLRRPKRKGEDHHYKAGNLNYALLRIWDEFIAIVDADMILSPEFLPSLLPHFTADNIAFVQSPQSYYNISPGDPLNGSGMFFYDVLLPHRDAWHAAQCVGTGAIFRRRCLSDVGLFATGSVTEDFDTSLRIHSRLYESVYIQQRFQVGLTPWTLESYIKQHQRWCLGGIQILLKRRPLCIKRRGFGLYRKLIYFHAGAHSFLAFVVVALLIMAQLLCFFDISLLPTSADSNDFRMYVIYLAPYLLAGRVMAQVFHLSIPGFLFRQQVRIRDEQSWWWMAPYNCMAVLRAFFPWVPKTFQATGSLADDESSRGCLAEFRSFWNEIYLVFFHLVYVLVGVAVIGWRFYTMDFRNCSRLMKSTIAMLFLLFGIQTLCAPIMYAMFPPSRGPAERRSMLKYNSDGVPIYSDDLGIPPTSWRVLCLEIVPTVLTIMWMYFVWVALHPHYTLAFCEVQFFAETSL